MDGKVSVIVPIYNVESYLERCINSILGQSYNELEIILVDDGSPDNCGAICDKYALIDNRIRVIHKANGGLSDARNAGLDLASGEYILFVDSDDWIEPEMVEYLLSLIRDYQAEIAICSYYEEDGNHSEVAQDMKPRIREYKLWNDALIALNYKGDAIGTVAWNKMYKSSLFDDLRFEIGRIHEDVYIMPKLFYYAKGVVTSTRKLYHYETKRIDSIMNEPVSDKTLDTIDAFYSNYLFFNAHNVSEFANVYWLKYYGSLIETYCKFRLHSMLDEGEQLSLRIRREYPQLIKTSICSGNLKELIRASLFSASKNLYFSIWRKHYGKQQSS